MELVDHVRAEHRPQRLRRRVARRLLAAGVGEAGEERLAGVGRVGRRVDVVVIERPGQGVVLGNVVVDAAERIRREVVAADLEARRLQTGIRQRDDLPLAARAANIAEQLRNRRIERRGLAVGRRQLQQVQGLGARRGAIGIQALRRPFGEDRAGARDLAGRPAVFVVEEEEGLVVPIEETGDRDRTADVEAGLVDQEIRLRRLAGRRIRREVAVVEERVRVEHVVLVGVEEVPLVGVGARLGDEADVDGSLAAAVGAVGRRGHRHFLDRVEARLDAGEEPVGGLQVIVLDADAVEGHVDRALRQAVDRRIARRARRVHAWQVDHEVECVAAGERQALDLLRRDRGCDRGRLGGDDFRAAGHDHLLLDAADFHLDRDAGRHAGAHIDVVDRRGLEP